MCESFVRGGKQSLLCRYSIPIENISFEFIKGCSDSKTLEKIIKILRSGEEGFYPQLLAAAEDKLKELDPKARILRVSEPVVKTVYPSANTTAALQDLKEWSSKISAVDKELTLLHRSRMPSYPEVRNASSSGNVNSNSGSVKTGRAIKATDYSSWDKYDPDAELLKLEIEEERKKAVQKKEKERKEREENEKRAQELSDISKQSMCLVAAERQKIAEDKRVKGNEYFKVKDFQLAIKYYSESIAIQETASAFCNRALAYMKLNENLQAVNDCTACLHYEPCNVKALFRRAQALQSMKQYHTALKDVTYLLEIEPKNSAALTLKNVLLNQIGSNQILARRSMFRRRIMVEDDDSYSDGCVKIIEVTDDELCKYSKYEYVELNEKNQLKEVCMCSLDSNYHRRSEELLSMNYTSIKSPFYRITRVKHCYPVKVDMNRPSTSAVINSNYLHVGINVNYRTPVRNIFVVPEAEKPIFNSSYLHQRTSSAVTTAANLNKMFDLRPRQNINEAITSKISHIDRSKCVLKNDLQKIMEISRGTSERRDDNLSTRLEILEIDSSTDKSNKPSNLNCNANDRKPQSLVNGSYKEANSSKVSSVSLSVCEQQGAGSKKLVHDSQSKNSDSCQGNFFSGCNGTEQLNGNISSEKSKFSTKLTHGSSTNDIIRHSDPNIANNNAPLSAKCHGDDESGTSCMKLNSAKSNASESEGTIVNGFSSSSEAKKNGKITNDFKSISQNMVNGHSLATSQPGLTPFQFMSKWQNVDQSKGLSEYEMLLRQVKPSSLSTVISNQLDDRMLSTMLSVFWSCFNLKEEFSVVIDYLIAIAELERFSVALCLRAPADVKVTRALFNDLESVIHVDLQQLSQFIQLKQAYLC